MTLPHAITGIGVGPNGISVALSCPYDGLDVAGMPEFAMPVCRQQRLGTCAALAAVADRGISSVWQGPAVQLAVGVEIGLWLDGDDIRMAATGETTESVEAIAQRLAHASGSARYNDPANPGTWRQLLVEPHLIGYAFNEAMRRGVVSEDRLRRWRERLDGHVRNTTRGAGGNG